MNVLQGAVKSVSPSGPKQNSSNRRMENVHTVTQHTHNHQHILVLAVHKSDPDSLKCILYQLGC